MVRGGWAGRRHLLYLEEQEEEQAGMQHTQHIMQVHRALKVGEGRGAGSKPLQGLGCRDDAAYVQPHTAESEECAQRLQPVAGATQEVRALAAGGEDGLEQQVEGRSQQQHLEGREWIDWLIDWLTDCFKFKSSKP